MIYALKSIGRRQPATLPVLPHISKAKEIAGCNGNFNRGESTGSEYGSAYGNISRKP